MPKRKPTNDSGRAAKKRVVATPPAADATAADGQTARRLQFSRDKSREAVAASPVLGESEEEIEESEASSTDSSVESAGEDASAAANADAQTAVADARAVTVADAPRRGTMDTGAGTGTQRAAADPSPNAEVAKALSALAALQAGAAEREAAMGDAIGKLTTIAAKAAKADDKTKKARTDAPRAVPWPQRGHGDGRFPVFTVDGLHPQEMVELSVRPRYRADRSPAVIEFCDGLLAPARDADAHEDQDEYVLDPILVPEVPIDRSGASAVGRTIVLTHPAQAPPRKQEAEARRLARLARQQPHRIASEVWAAGAPSPGLVLHTLRGHHP